MNHYKVEPGEKVNITALDPGDLSEWQGTKEAAEDRLNQLKDRLDELQLVLFAQKKHRVLVILQGIDTGGKDGTIHKVFSGINPEGVRVANFKAPTPEELSHDFLWRIHKQVPGAGELVLFNRSQYEDVLVVRVHNLVPPEVWQKRYDQINHFEKMLAETGTTILKFLLNISKDEQKRRLEDRLKEPDKRWKFNPDDLKERDLWPEYMEAYEAVLNRTSTDWAPWWAIPADHKWYRDLMVAEIVVRELDGLNMSYPQPNFDPEKIIIR